MEETQSVHSSIRAFTLCSGCVVEVPRSGLSENNTCVEEFTPLRRNIACFERVGYMEMGGQCIHHRGYIQSLAMSLH